MTSATIHTEKGDIQVDLGHPSLRGVEDVFEGLVTGCSADVFVGD